MQQERLQETPTAQESSFCPLCVMPAFADPTHSRVTRTWPCPGFWERELEVSQVLATIPIFVPVPKIKWQLKKHGTIPCSSQSLSLTSPIVCDHLHLDLQLCVKVNQV